jgi:hypothetical protein
MKTGNSKEMAKNTLNVYEEVLRNEINNW